MNEDIRKKKTEEEYRLILENANDLIAVLNEKSEYEFINEKTHLKLTGYEREDLIGKPALDLVHPDEREGAKKAIQKAFEVGEYTGELRMRNKKGFYGWIHVKSKVFNDQEGKRKILTIARDITKRKKFENALRESEERYKNLFKSSPDGIVTTTLDGKFLNANKAYQDMLGYTLEELKSMNFQLITPKKWHEAEAEAIKNFMFEGQGTFEKEYIRKDGTIFPISLTGWLIKDEQGNPTKIGALIKDITERKFAEQKLKESENKFRNLYENALAGLWTSRIEDGKFIRANDTAAKIAGYENAEDLMNNSTAIKLFNYEDRVEFIRQLREYGVKSGFEAELVDKDGNRKEISISGEINQEKGTIEGVFIDISERIKSEQKLRESEEKYSNLFQGSNDAIFIHDLEGNIIDVNQKVLDLFGYTKSEMLSLKIAEIHPNEALSMSKKAFEEISQKGFVRFEINFKKKNGVIFPAEVSSSIFNLGENKVIQGIVRNITDRKRAELKLKDSELKYRHLFESSPYFIGLLDLKGNLIDCNTAVNKFLSIHTKEDLIGKNFTEIVSLTDRNKHLSPIFKELFYTIIKGEIIEAVEFPIYRSIGDIKWLSLHASLIEIENETLIQILIQDITKKKKAEQDLKESEEKYRILVETSPNSIVLLDKNGIIIDCNKETELLIDLDRKEIVGKNFIDLYTMPRNKIPNLIEMFEKIKKGEINYPIEFEYVDKRGKKVIVESYVSLVKLENEMLIQIVSRNITHRKAAEQSLKESEEKYRILVEKSLQGICILQDLRIIFANKALSEILGYNIEELLSLSSEEVINLIYHDDRELVSNRHMERLNGKKVPSHYEFRVIRKDGIVRTVEMYATILTFNGKPAVQEVFVDITERKNAEQKLRESEEKYRNIIESIKEGYFEVDLKGSFTFFNDALCEMTGYTREEAMGTNFSNYMSEENSKRTFEVFNDVYNTGIPEKSLQYEIISKDGRIIYGESSVYLRYDFNGDKVGFSGFLRDVTEKRDAEKKLKESEGKFRTITEQSLLGICILQDNLVKYANQHLSELCGYSIEEMKSWNSEEYINIIHPDYQKIVFERASKKQKGLKDVINQYVLKIIKKTGEVRWVENYSKTITYQNRPADLIILIDITDKKKAEEKLKDSEEKYRKMIDELDLGFYQIAWDGSILNINPAFRKIMGYDESVNINEMNTLDFWKTDEDRKKFVKGLLEHNIIDDFIAQGKNRYNLDVALRVDSHLIRDENGKPIRIEGTVADITDKFKLEQKLKRSEERYRHLFESSPFAIILIDYNNIVRECNPASEEIIGYKKEELIGRSLYNLSIVHPEFVPIFVKRLKIYFKGQLLPPIDVKLYKKDGTLFWAHILSTSIKLGNETFIQVMGYDITERKKAELLVKEEVEKLKELDHIRKELISRVSHELKTPLIPVLGGSEYLLHSYKFDKEQLEILEMIEKGGKRLAKLVENLLDITRIEYEKFELKKKITNLGEMIKDTVSDMKYLIKKRDINLNLVVPDDLYLEIDSSRMEQVITNLLSNAIKNSPPKGRVSLALEKYGNWAIFSVSDTGVGFTEEEMKRIFTRFGKIERYGEGLEYVDMEGSGLGLYITKQIVDLHGGKIWVESTGRNRGCIFNVRLPII